MQRDNPTEPAEPSFEDDDREPSRSPRSRGTVDALETMTHELTRALDRFDEAIEHADRLIESDDCEEHTPPTDP